MRIALFIRTFEPCSGGLQKHASDLARHLTAKGHDVHIVTRLVSYHPKDYLDSFIYSEKEKLTRIEGVPVHVLTHSAFMIPLLWISMKCVGRQITRKFGVALYSFIFIKGCLRSLGRVDLVHHVGQGYEMLGFTAHHFARRIGAPFVVQPTVHPGQWGDHDIDQMLYRRADRLLSHTEFEAKWHQSRFPGVPVDVVGNGIDILGDGDSKRFQQTHGVSGPIILFLGRKEKDKGYFLLKETIPLVLEQRPDAVFVLMGPLPATNGSAPPTSDRVIEINSASDQEKNDALAACEMLCVPSEGESFGLVYMEAGRYSKPVIGRDIPVLQELIGRNRAGLLVGKTTSEHACYAAVTPVELARAVLKLLQDKSLRRELGENCHRVSEQFTWPHIVQRFEASYITAKKNKSCTP